MSLVEGLSIFLIIPIIDAISGSGLKQSHFLFTLVLDFIGGATPQQTIINAATALIIITLLRSIFELVSRISASYFIVNLQETLIAHAVKNFVNVSIAFSLTDQHGVFRQNIWNT